MVAFAGARSKLDHAEEHLFALDGEVLAYLDRRPFTVVLNLQPSDRHLVLIEFHVLEQPPNRLSLLVGDCVHNLRSSLDHVVCDLVTDLGADCDRTQFPIPRNPPTDRAGRPRPLDVGAPIDPGALAVIDRVQPYHLGDDAPLHPLAILRELSNIDKHRTLHTTAAQATGTQAFLQFPNGPLFGGQFTDRVAHDQTPIGVFEFAEPFDREAYRDVEVGASGATFVAIEQAGPWADRPLTPLLDEILSFVRDEVVLALEPFLGAR